jgi:hypothetical protein
MMNMPPPSTRHNGGMKSTKRTSNSSNDFYQRRYPSYSSSFSRNSPYYASLTSPTRVKVSPHSLYDSLLTTTSSQSTPKSKDFQPKSSTTGMNETRVTQTVKSTTDMELQLLLPLGNIMKAAINAKKQALKDNFFREEYNREPPPSSTSNKPTDATENGNKDHNSIPIHLDKSSGIKLNVGEPKSHTEIKTRIDKNGIVEEHNQSLPNVDIANSRSKVEINVNGKTLDLGWTNHSNFGSNTKTSQANPIPSCANSGHHFQNNSDSNNSNNERKSKWSRIGGVTLSGGNSEDGFHNDIKVSII